ncbi:MAG: hypothetical protein GEU26_11505 [Nitrososphaeraceae archaeon]|nr:hypothetical protein [Nitrososphaeraceae archaeon]
MKIEKKSIMPLLMATVVLLAGFNTHTILGHNFSPDESASFLALVNTLKAEAQMVQQNLATNNMSLASDHANKALALMTDDVNKEIAERNQRLSDDLNTALVSLKTSTESAHGNKTASDTDLLVNDIDDILDEIVTARIDPDQLNNSTIQVLAVVELLDEVLRNYGYAFAVGYDMTNMSMMTMDGNNNTNNSSENSSIHSMSTMNMGGGDGSNNMSIEDMSNSNDILINTTDYQTAQALAMKVQELFDNQIMNSSLSEGSQTANQTINNVSAALEDLVTSIDGKASPMDIMTIVHTRIHPNLMTAFGLQLENG